MLFRLGKELENGRGNDAKRPFRTYEQVLQVISGVVLPQCAKAVPDASVCQYHLKPKDHVSGIPVSKHRRAAGIGRKIAADLAASFRRKRQWKQPIDLVGLLLGLLQNDPCLDGHCIAQRVNLPDPIQSR